VDRLEHAAGGRRAPVFTPPWIAAFVLVAALGVALGRAPLDLRVVLAVAAVVAAGVSLTMRELRAREQRIRSQMVQAEEAAGFQRALAELTLAALNREGLQATLALVCERARALLACDVVTVFLLEDGLLVPRAVHPVADDVTLAPVELEDEGSPTAAAARECRAVLADGGLPGHWRIPDHMTALGVRRALALPLVGRKGRVLGTLTCGDRGDARDLGAFQIRGELLAAQAAAAVARAALVDRLREEAERVGALLRVSREIGHEVPYGEMLVTMCRLTRQILNADRAVVLRWDDEKARLMTAVHDGMTPAEAEHGAPFDVAEASAWWSLPEEGRLIVAPLTHADRRYGLLAARRGDDASRFDARQMALLEGIARQCAMALDNLRLLQEERTAASLALTILNVAQEFTRALDPPQLLARLAARATELTGAAAAVVAVREPGESLYRIACAHGLPLEQVERLQGVELDDAELARYLAHAAGAETEGCRHLSVPMERAGEGVGVLLLVWHEGESPTHRESALALGLANQAAIALETVRLVDGSQRANRLKSDFVATMSHELRTPLNVIMGYTDLLIEQAFGPLTEEQTGVLTRMQRSARELLDLITQTLDLSRLETGKSGVTVETVTVPDLFAQLEAETAERLDRGDLRIDWHVDPALPPIQTDVAKLRTILKNLIGNAIKFTEQGSVSVTAERVEDDVVFAVKDTGIGIKTEDLPVIFEMFRQVEAPNTRRHGGVGLGLYIVKRYLSELRGDIDVESAAGAGSRFRIRLPVRLGGQPPSAAAS